MAKIVIIGGIESTFTNAQVLFEQGEDILAFFTRGANSPGWEGVDLINPKNYTFTRSTIIREVQGDINEYAAEISDLKPDYIYSLGWQQIFRKELLSICPIIGLHESLLPRGAGPVPIANSILHDEPVTGVTLFWVDSGMDTGNIIAQLKGREDPRMTTSTQLYQEAMFLEKELLKTMLPYINSGLAPSIPQAMTNRTVYKKIDWMDWPEAKVRRAKIYPYV